MKYFHDETTATPELDGEAAATAHLAIEAGVRLIRFVRRAIRSSPPATLSLSRVRALAFVAENPDACVSALAEHLLVGAPTASKVAQDLVERGLLSRSADGSDRRRVTLRATEDGERLLDIAARPAQRRLAVLVAGLDEQERWRLTEGLTLLRSLLDPSGREAADA